MIHQIRLETEYSDSGAFITASLVKDPKNVKAVLVDDEFVSLVFDNHRGFDTGNCVLIKLHELKLALDALASIDCIY